MKKTMISILALCSTIALANAQVGIKGDTKTSDFSNYAGQVEVFGKYDSDAVKFEAKSHLINYEGNAIQNVIVNDYFAKLDADLLKSDLHDVKLGAYITRNGGDDYKINDKNNKAQAYLTYTNRVVKNLELSSTTKIGADLKKDGSFEKSFFSQALKGVLKLGSYTNTTDLTYKFDKNHNLDFANKSELEVKGVKLGVTPKISMVKLDVDADRTYKPGLDLEASATVKKADLSSKVYTEFEVKEADAAHFGNTSGLELGAKLAFGKVSLNPKASTEFGLVRNDGTHEVEGFSNTSKLSVETAYMGEKFEIKVTPSAESNLVYQNATLKNKQDDGKDVDLFKAALKIDAKAMVTENVDLKVKNELSANLTKFADLEKTVKNDLTLAADLHKNVDGFNLALIPSFKVVVEQDWNKDNALKDVKFKKHDSEDKIVGKAFVSLMPKLELKVSKEFNEGFVFEFGANGSRTFNFVRDAAGTVSVPNGDDSGQDLGTKASPYEVGANLGLTYKF